MLRNSGRENMESNKKTIQSIRTREAFKILPTEFQDKDRLIHKLFEIQAALIEELEQSKAGSSSDTCAGLKSGLARIVFNAWKAKAKMIDGSKGEPREEMRRVYPHIESIFDAFAQLGIRVKDHTGDAFDYGLPLTVIATQPTPGLTKERVIETIKPTIYWNETNIQAGEVVIATPMPT
jgi:hypothetical protein